MKIANNYVSFEQLQRRNWKLIEGVPCVIFAKVGAAIMLDRKRIVRIPFLIDNNTMAYIFDGSWDADFGKTLFETIPLPRYAQVGALPSYNGSDIEDIEVCVPTKEEQTKIAELFVSLDNLITLHQRKLLKLKNVKKAMLEKMFPKNGSNVPEIRFAGFTDAWEQRKFRDLCDVFTDGDWIESKDQSDSGVRLVQTGNVGVAEYLEKPNNRKWISEETFVRLNCEEVLPGDILISRLPEPAGRACIMPYLGMKMITAVDCTIVRTSSDCFNKFLIQYLSSQDYFNLVNTDLAGGTRQRISRSNLASFNIPTPVKYEEQEAIGKYFEQLDNLITLHQRKYEKLQNLKKACLEKMFV